MNTDFHYYATFYAALNAGFEKNKALKIAWAAEMVDRLNLDLARKYKHVLKDDYIITVQSGAEEYWKDWWQDEADYNNRVAQGMRGIWVPFHFLPGHIDDENAGYKEIKEKEYVMYYDTVDIAKCDKHYMDACLRLRCAPYSSTVKAMINYFKDIIHSKEGDKWTDEALYGLGICMHVLADTWSHNSFCGLTCYFVNKAVLLHAKITPFTGNIHFTDIDHTIDASIVEWIIKDNCLMSKQNSSIFLGHAQVGSVPDYDFLSYKYHHRFNYKNLSKIGEKPSDRKNYSEFRDALLGMFNALCFIKDDNNAIKYDLEDKSQFGSKADEVMESVFCKFPPNKLNHKRIVNHKIQIWNGNEKECFFKSQLGYSITPFDIHAIEKFGQALTFEGELRKFAHQAKLYRNYMFHYIDNQLVNSYKTNPLDINGNKYSMPPLRFDTAFRKEVDSWLIDIG